MKTSTIRLLTFAGVLSEVSSFIKLRQLNSSATFWPLLFCKDPKSEEFAMKPKTRNMFNHHLTAWRATYVLPALIAGLVFTPAGRTMAQFTTLDYFGGGAENDPQLGVILGDGILYGTVQDAGGSGTGTLFTVHSDGSGLTTLLTFGGSHGSYPQAGLILSGHTLYGTTSGGTTFASVFAVNTDGTDFKTLAASTGGIGTGDFGSYPLAGVILSGNTLYGTDSEGGPGISAYGTIYALSTAGNYYTTLHNFLSLSGGSTPKAGLIQCGNTLYGTTAYGGSSGDGTVFAINTDGTGFTNLYNFTGGSDGANPVAALIQSGSTFYGTASAGGTSGAGTVFAINTNGTGFTTLHSFNGVNDGEQPLAGLIQSGNTLYGTTAYGGTSGTGTIFAVNTDGTWFTNLYSFGALLGPFVNQDGIAPSTPLLLSGGTLYGTTSDGGLVGGGTMFSFSFAAPSLTIKRDTTGENLVLSWTAESPGFVLESTPSVSSGFWNTVSQPPVLVNGQNSVTLPISANMMYYQLVLPAAPSGTALIPAGWFTMGDSLDGESDATPLANVYLPDFFMDANPVSYSQWQTVYAYALSQGYGFDDSGSGKGATQPVESVNWYDAVKWCNARSQQAGLTPAYYTDALLTHVYKTGDTDAVYVNWGGIGYRLPTEAEWEKAARGGLNQQRFPLGNNIAETQANYDGNTALTYDLGPNGFNSIGSVGGTSPATSPVGSFAANGYGLYDMAGNVYEWCWDWYGTPYGQPRTIYPTGPATGLNRVLRGGDWRGSAYDARCANRAADEPSVAGILSEEEGFGFRCVRGL